jgi:lipoprotein NlpD
MLSASLRRFLFVLSFALLLEGCGGSGFLAPVGKDPRVNDITSPKKRVAKKHVVRKGETLYAIAFRYGMDYREIARSNGIASPFVIYSDQSLLIDPDHTVARVASTRDKQTLSVKGSTDKQAKTAKVITKRKTETNSKPTETAKKVTDSAATQWTWPVKGKLLKSFKGSGDKGIDIAGELGQPVRAAAAGKVVYSGGGLIGFGELIIIKHNKRYLSAYGHNNKLLVKQGAMVESGQHIANMGRSGTDIIKLHFEIRRDGKPIDPIRYLPN